MSIVYENNILYNDNINFKILDGIADLIRVLDSNNEAIFVNNAMEKALGYDIESRVCSLHGDVLDERITLRTLQTGEIIQREEHIDNQYFSVKCSPIKGRNGENIGVVEVFRNITRERKLISEIVEKNRNLTIEMTHAQKIQRALIPEKGFFENIKIDYFYNPSYLLSGDMFDIFKINEDNIGVYIADSVGHGFASSMITMFIRLLIRNTSKSKLFSPARTLKEIWRNFSALNLEIDMYFTCFYGVYNKKLSKFTYSNAGHFPAPILVRDKRSYNLSADGYPISRFFEDVSYTNYEINLNTSDKILFMTDGITEAKNKSGENFGLQNVVDIIRDNNEDELSVLKSEIFNFVDEEQRDDITALLLKIW